MNCTETIQDRQKKCVSFLRCLRWVGWQHAASPSTPALSSINRQAYFCYSIDITVMTRGSSSSSRANTDVTSFRRQQGTVSCRMSEWVILSFTSRARHSRNVSLGDVSPRAITCTHNKLTYNNKLHTHKHNHSHNTSKQKILMYAHSLTIPIQNLKPGLGSFYAIRPGKG